MAALFCWSWSGAVPVQKGEASTALGATCLKSNVTPSAPKPRTSNACFCQAAWLFPRSFQSSWVKQKLHNLSLFSRNELCFLQSLSRQIQWNWASCECRCHLYEKRIREKKRMKKEISNWLPVICSIICYWCILAMCFRNGWLKSFFPRPSLERNKIV